MTDSLPDEVVFHHILPWLPTKSLLRFRCVCKSWNSFILDPSFLHLRRSASRTHGHLLFVCPASAVATSEPNVFSAPVYGGQADMAHSSPTHIATLSNRRASKVGVQMVNGLLCFHPKNYSYSEAFAQICNPTTRQIITLPDDAPVRKNFYISTHFGYDPIRDRFKVLRLLKYRDSHEFKIFTVGDTNNTWRRITPTLPIDPMTWLKEGKRGICVNGAIHWKYSSHIVAFDLGDEQFREINIPHGYSFKQLSLPYLKYPDLVELGGCLSLIGYSDGALNLWILKDETQEWVPKSITLPCGIGARERIHFPLCRVPTTGEILLVPYFVARLVRVIYHDMENLSSRRAVVMKMPQPLWPDQISGDLDIFFYQESFRILK